jgi:pimeloyl-ACP methyl ester carboxylesterase
MQYPAIVLAHDFGRGPDQMMPLLAPLHEDGFVVVAVGLRGAGAGRSKGQTFGVYESQDVLAAVNMLRRRPFVDPDRIGVLGMGTGANAALLAAQRDGRLGAVALADPVPTPDDAIARYVGPDQYGLRWMQVLNKWTFQMAYHVDLDEMRLSRVDVLSPSRPVLRLDGRTTVDGRLMPGAVEEVRSFYRTHLTDKAAKPGTPPAEKPAVAEGR